MRRSIEVSLNRDSDYPRWSNEYYRRRWCWTTRLTNESYTKPFGIYTGDASFAIVALICGHFPTLFGKPVEKSV